MGLRRRFFQFFILRYEHLFKIAEYKWNQRFGDYNKTYATFKTGLFVIRFL